MLKYLSAILFVLVILFSTTYAAEQFEFTECYSGTATVFHNNKDLPLVLSWATNGINMSDDVRFNNTVAHCEGVQYGVGPKREGYALCTIMDVDGDMIIGKFPYSGLEYEVKFIEGTGKWKGIKGSYGSKRIVKSKPGKGSMPGTFQGCRKNQGTFELSK